VTTNWSRVSVSSICCHAVVTAHRKCWQVQRWSSVMAIKNDATIADNDYWQKTKKKNTSYKKNILQNWRHSLTYVQHEISFETALLKYVLTEALTTDYTYVRLPVRPAWQCHRLCNSSTVLAYEAASPNVSALAYIKSSTTKTFSHYNGYLKHWLLLSSVSSN
jgi:hypothetical protein